MPQREPIGMFDSGLGGLSVLRELIRLVPERDVVYVADSAHVPYGTKPPAFIRERSLAIAGFLVEGQHAETVVVACNTATTHAVAIVRERFPSTPIVGMEPALKPAAAATRSGIVGVLATPATLVGERFVELAQRYTDGIELLTQPSPGLVEQVEAGDLDGPETERLLRLYTEPMLARGADTIVLGCTHYPFLRATLQRIVGPSITLIDTGAAVARQTARVLGYAQADLKVGLYDESLDDKSPDLSAGIDDESPALKVGIDDRIRAGRTTYFSSGDVTVATRVIGVLMRASVDVVHALPV